MKTLFSFLTLHPKRALALSVLWTTLILVACFLPGKDLPEVDVVDFDKLVHVALFSGCAFLWAVAFIRHSGKTWRKLFWVFIATIALGILVELIQGSDLVRGRSADIFDVFADAVGACLGSFSARYVLPKRP